VYNTHLIHQDTLSVPTVNGHKQTQILVVNLNIDISEENFVLLSEANKSLFTDLTQCPGTQLSV